MVHNKLALPTLLYGCETWAIREKNKYRMPAEMIFMRRMAKYIWQDYKTNEYILSELKINPVVKKKIRRKWIKHVLRMDRDRQTATRNCGI